MNAYRIYPAIGVARVGDARQKFYIGPETYRGLPINPDGAPFTERDFRDAEGRMCRQAARFKIYRDTPQGKEEVTLSTPGVKSIEWTVHVANKKAAWYEFKTNSGEYGYASNHPLRNAWQPDRQQLVIDAGPRSISGRGRPLCVTFLEVRDTLVSGRLDLFRRRGRGNARGGKREKNRPPGGANNGGHARTPGVVSATSEHSNSNMRRGTPTAGRLGNYSH